MYCEIFVREGNKCVAHKWHIFVYDKHTKICTYFVKGVGWNTDSDFDINVFIFFLHEQTIHTKTCLLMRQLRSGMFFALKEVNIFMCVWWKNDWFLWHVGNYESWVMKSRIFYEYIVCVCNLVKKPTTGITKLSTSHKHDTARSTIDNWCGNRMHLNIVNNRLYVLETVAMCIF